MSSKSTPAYRNNKRIGWASWIKEHAIWLKVLLIPSELFWFWFYYPPGAMRGKYHGLGVFRLQYSPLVSVCIIVHHKCIKKSCVVKIRNTSEAVLRPQFKYWPSYWLWDFRLGDCGTSDESRYMMALGHIVAWSLPPLCSPSLFKESKVVHQDGSLNPGSKKHILLVHD